jgi:hypothetical protein
MRRVKKLKLLAIVILVIGCAVMPPKRQYIKHVKRQVVPKEILNSKWVLETFDGQAPDCVLTMTFLEKGQLTFTFKDRLYNGDELWYLAKDSVIEFHTTPLEKMAWTFDNCKMNPSVFARYLMGDKKVQIADNNLTFDKKKFVFTKL